MTCDHCHLPLRPKARLCRCSWWLCSAMLHTTGHCRRRHVQAHIQHIIMPIKTGESVTSPSAPV